MNGTRAMGPALVLLAAVAACGEFGLMPGDPVPPPSEGGAPQPDAARPPELPADANSDAAVEFDCVTRTEIPLRCDRADAAADAASPHCQGLREGEPSDGGPTPLRDGGLQLTSGESNVAGLLWTLAPLSWRGAFRVTADVSVQPQANKPADGFAIAFVARDEAYDGGAFPTHSGPAGSDLGLAGMRGFHGTSAMVLTYAGAATAPIGQLTLGVRDLPAGVFRSVELPVAPTFAAGEGVRARLVVERPGSDVVARASLWRWQKDQWVFLSSKDFDVLPFDSIGVSAASGALASVQWLERLEICSHEAR